MPEQERNIDQGALAMKRKQPAHSEPKDTPATRKRRLQQRLQELSDRSEREMAALAKSLDKVKKSFRTKKDNSNS